MFANCVDSTDFFVKPQSCVGSNLFRAFSEHFLYRMKIQQEGPLIRNNKNKIRITLLQRGNPSKKSVFRQIRNQDMLVSALKRLDNVELTVSLAIGVSNSYVNEGKNCQCFQREDWVRTVFGQAK